MRYGRRMPFRQQMVKPTALPPEANRWWWNPGRLTVTRGPSYFRSQLDNIHPDLELTWNAYGQEWLIWLRNSDVKSKVCAGWNLLFTTRGRLDERVFARLYEASSQKWGGAKHYFDAIEREITRDQERHERGRLNDLHAEGADWFNHSQISVAMRGKSNGSKFSKYLS